MLRESEPRIRADAVTSARRPRHAITPDPIGDVQTSAEQRTILESLPCDGFDLVDAFGAHVLEGTLGVVGDRDIGPGHVILSAERYAWLMSHLPDFSND